MDQLATGMALRPSTLPPYLNWTARPCRQLAYASFASLCLIARKTRQGVIGICGIMPPSAFATALAMADMVTTIVRHGNFEHLHHTGFGIHFDFGNLCAKRMCHRAKSDRRIIKTSAHDEAAMMAIVVCEPWPISGVPVNVK